MRLFVPVFLALSLMAGMSFANCAGRDLRQVLTPQEQSEISDRLKSIPFAQGNHWVARKGAKTLHIVGTVHLGDPRLAPVTEALLPVIRNADLLMVEATREEQALLEQSFSTRPELFFLQTGPTLPDLLDEATWAEMQTLAAKRGLPGFMVAKMQPWYLSLLLAIPACAMSQLQEGKEGLDGQLMDAADRFGVPMLALEPHDTLFRLMGSDPLDEQIEMMTLGILPEQVVEDMHRTLLASYFEEKAAELFEVNRIVVRRHIDLPPEEIDALMDDMLADLLDTRNLAWMPVIRSAPDGLSIVAVGAGHLPGEVGILNLLQKDGYTLTRQPF